MNTLKQKLDNEMHAFKKTYETMETIQTYNDWYIIMFHESCYEFLTYLIENEHCYNSDNILRWLNIFENPLGFLYSEWLSCDNAFSLSWDDMFIWLMDLMVETNI